MCLLGTAPSYSTTVWITFCLLDIILDSCIRTWLVCRLLQTEHNLWFTLIIAKLGSTLCFAVEYLILRLNTHTHAHTHIDHSWGGECEVWPFYPLSSPWGSVWVQYSGDVPLWLLMSPIQYEARLEGHLPFTHRHTHSLREHCLSLTCTSLLSWLLMWRGPSEAFSHHSCSLCLTTVALCPYTRLLPCIPVNKPWDDINRWTVLSSHE